MADETESPVLELLRGMRGDMAAVDGRLDGIRSVLVGSMTTDPKGREARFAALEGASA